MLSYAWTWMQTLGVGLRSRDEGATMVEYGLMVALIAIVAAVAVAFIGTNLFGLFNKVATNRDPVALAGPDPTVGISGGFSPPMFPRWSWASTGRLPGTEKGEVP